MCNPNVKPSEMAPIMTVLDPVSQGAATVVTGWVSMVTFEQALATLMVGALGGGATVDAKLRQATSAAGANAKDITGKAITQLTKAGTDDNKQVQINCTADDLDRDNSFTHVALSVTVANAACLIAALIQGFNAHYEPAADATTVDEVVG